MENIKVSAKALEIAALMVGPEASLKIGAIIPNGDVKPSIRHYLYIAQLIDQHIQKESLD